MRGKETCYPPLLVEGPLFCNGPEKQSLFSLATAMHDVDVALEIRVADTDEVEWRDITNEN